MNMKHYLPKVTDLNNGNVSIPKNLAQRLLEEIREAFVDAREWKDKASKVITKAMMSCDPTSIESLEDTRAQINEYLDMTQAFIELHEIITKSDQAEVEKYETVLED